MMRLRLPLAGLGLALLTSALSAAEPQPLVPVLPGPAAIQFNEEAAVQRLTAAIDQLMDDFWKRNDIKPSDPTTDAEFLRRISLDLAGRIPHAAELRAFLADKNPHKRAKKIDELLGRAGFVSHFSGVLRRDWVPQAAEDPRLQFAGIQFENWLVGRVRANTALDDLVRDMLTAPTLFARNAPQVERFDLNSASPMAFNQVNEFKPENVAAAASRLFMGVKLECAQCHDHPFAPYKRDLFWEQAAFFAEVQPAVANASDVTFKRRIRIPDTTKTVQAKFFNGSDPDWRDGESPRQTFVRWLTGAENPYFARNAANRMWAYFFGLGFIDPVDEPSDDNQATVPEVLDTLARAFTESRYDLKLLMRAITRSKAYQLSSRLTDPSQGESRTFARMNVKGLSAEQLFDSLAMATGYRDPTPQNQRRFNGFGGGGVRGEFLVKFASTEKRTERQTSILQALTLMNGRFINDQTSLDRSETLAAIADYPFPSTEQRVEALFLTALSRPPTPEELQKFASYVERGGAASDRKKALADVFWSLLNTSEFILNH